MKDCPTKRPNLASLPLRRFNVNVHGAQRAVNGALASSSAWPASRSAPRTMHWTGHAAQAARGLALVRTRRSAPHSAYDKERTMRNIILAAIVVGVPLLFGCGCSKSDESKVAKGNYESQPISGTTSTQTERTHEEEGQKRGITPDLLDDSDLFGGPAQDFRASLAELSENGMFGMWLMANREQVLLGGNTSETDNPSFNAVAFLRRLQTGKLGKWQLKPVPLATIQKKYGDATKTETEMRAENFQMVTINWHVYGNVWLGTQGSGQDVTWVKLLPAAATESAPREKRKPNNTPEQEKTLTEYPKSIEVIGNMKGSALSPDPLSDGPITYSGDLKGFE